MRHGASAQRYRAEGREAGARAREQRDAADKVGNLLAEPPLQLISVLGAHGGHRLRARIAVFLLLGCAAPSLADYATEVKALGGAAVHDTIASADSCEVSEVKHFTFDGEPRFVMVGEPKVSSGELKHVLTQTIGRAALRRHRPEHPAGPTHLIRVKRGKHVVDVFISTADGSLRVVRSGKLVPTLGERKDAAEWARLLGRQGRRGA